MRKGGVVVKPRMSGLEHSDDISIEGANTD